MPVAPHWKMANTPRHLSLNYMICINSLLSIFSRSHIHSQLNTHTLRQRAFQLGKCCKKCHYEVHFETGSNVKSAHLKGKRCFDGMILQRACASLDSCQTLWMDKRAVNNIPVKGLPVSSKLEHFSGNQFIITWTIVGKRKGQKRHCRQEYNDGL